MQRLGFLDEWLEATARASKPAVVFSSLYPFQGDTLYAIPPATLWPPPSGLLHSPSPVFLTKIRWKTARFVPLSVIDSLITGQPILADQWLPDPESGCLLRRDRPSASPFRVTVRSTAGVDRVNRTSDEAKPMACVEFEPTSGLWTVVRFADSAQEQIWNSRLQAAFRLLSDSGFGGGRSKGWGQTQTAEFHSGSWPALVLPKLGRHLRSAPAVQTEETPGLFWLLSLYSPALADKVDWSGGNYSLAVRGGRVESLSGQGAVKKVVRMVNEGCVLASHEEPAGAALDVAPDGFAHPVYRSGLALTLRLPVVEVQPQEKIVEEESFVPEPLIDDEPPAPSVPKESVPAEAPAETAEAPVETVETPVETTATPAEGAEIAPVAHEEATSPEPPEPEPAESAPAPSEPAQAEPTDSPAEPVKDEEPPHEI
jgi:CRISPR type III-A-associated RAMP protein Csm4